MTRRAFIGLGSNLGNREDYLRLAIRGLPDVTNVSPVYETAPIGGPGDQGPFLNCVVELRTSLSARDLLTVAKRLESEAERVRTVKDGPRTLDVDILLIEDEVIAEPDLLVPHPRMWERRFVMQPLADIASDVVADDWQEFAMGDVVPFTTSPTFPHQ